MLAAAIIAGGFAEGQKIFALYTPAAEGRPPVYDVRNAGQKIALYRCFYTAWATLILLIPALVFFWFRRRSEKAFLWWQVFWTVSYAAFLVHFFWATMIFFEGDWQAMQNTTRVKAFWPDIIVTVWWGIDVLLSWLIKKENRLIGVQRVAVHLAVFTLFALGALMKGEVLFSKILGVSLVAAVLFALVQYARGRKVILLD